MTDTQVMAALIVTQADREAAADVLFHVDGDPFVEHIREGLEDDSYLVQAFARHRIASSSPAEPVAYTGSGSMMALKDGREGYIWPQPADAHPIPLYTAPLPPPAGDAEVRK